MKTLSKLLIVGLALIIVGLAGYIFIQKRQAEKSSPLTQVAKKNIESEAKLIATEVDKNGLQHTIFKIVKEIDHSAVDKVTADLLDTVGALNIARDKLRQVSIINTSLVIQNQQLVRKVNQQSTSYSHSDKNLNVSVDIPNDSTRSATFSAGYDADLITTQYNKGSWLLGNSHYMDIYSNDPRFTIRGARTLTVKQQVSPVSFQAYGSIGYNKFFGGSAGPSANLNIGRLRLTGDYKYYVQPNKWYWGAEVGYRIIGF